jgi:hypothetical protein
MLIDPPVNVCVPPDVVTLILSSVLAAARLFEPAVHHVTEAFELPTIPEADQVLLAKSTSMKVTVPLTICEELQFDVLTPNPIPVVKLTVTAEALEITLLEPAYPVLVYPKSEDPIWMSGGEVPLVLTELNPTVIRFTHEGMSVKLIAVPDVEAWTVPEVTAPLMPPTTSRVVVGEVVPIPTRPVELTTTSSEPPPVLLNPDGE